MADLSLPRPRRSVLYVPADKPRAVAKAAELPCDAVILDLEDAVAPEARGAARAGVARLIGSGGYPGKELIVRVNGLASTAIAEDLVAAAGADAVLVPKIDGPEDIRRAEAGLHALAAGSPRPALWAMIETPRAVLSLAAIAAEAETAESRLAAFVVGTNDLVKETRAQMTASRLALLPWLQQAVLAARAYGLAVIDGVCNSLDSPEALLAECRQGRGLGFDGKSLIHPSQIDAANRVFGPSEAEVEEARAVVAAFADPANAGKGVIAVDGRMTERLHLVMAERVLAVKALIDGAGA